MNVQLTGRESIVFKSCETLSVEASVNDVNIQQAMLNGNIIGVKSFVEFDVCQSEYCYTGDGGNRTTYVTSLADYMAAFSQFLPTQQQEYCQGCIDNNDYCQIEYPNYYEQARQNNGGVRKLAGDVFYETIDCNRCYNYQCLYTDNELYNYQQEWTQKHSLEWIQSMASCYRDNENPIRINGAQVSFGFMCNEEGTGVEVAAFMDDQCTLYTNQVAFGNVMSSKDNYMWYKSKANVEYIFNNDFSCYDPEVVYVSPDFDGWDQVQNSNGQGDDYQPDAGEWCWNVFGGDMTPVPMADCGSEGETSYENSYNTYAYNNNYNYSLSQEESQDATAACSKLSTNGGGEHIYSHSGSGAMYSYKSQANSVAYAASASGASVTESNSTNSTRNNWMSSLDAMTTEFQKNSEGKSRSGWVYGMIALSCVAVVVGAVVLKSKRPSLFSDKERPILSGEQGTMNIRRPAFRPKLIIS